MVGFGGRGDIGRKVGWKSGNLTARNVNILDDLFLQRDIILRDKTAGRLALQDRLRIKDQDGATLLSIDENGNLRIRGKVMRV